MVGRCRECCPYEMARTLGYPRTDTSLERSVERSGGVIISNPKDAAAKKSFFEDTLYHGTVKSFKDKNYVTAGAKAVSSTLGATIWSICSFAFPLLLTVAVGVMGYHEFGVAGAIVGSLASLVTTSIAGMGFSLIGAAFMKAGGSKMKWSDSFWLKHVVSEDAFNSFMNAAFFVSLFNLMTRR